MSTIIDFPPGSDIAIEHGCTCPVLDNAHGKGAYGGGVRDKDGNIMYWINHNCPLHSKAKYSPTPDASSDGV